MFEFNGNSITNPFMSEGLMFQVDPQKYYGFEVFEMGGGNVALRKDLDDGYYVLLTDETGLDTPDNPNKWCMGLYDSKNELIDIIEEF